MAESAGSAKGIFTCTIFARDQNKLAHDVSREIKTIWRMFRANMFLCPVMAVSAILTSNLTIKLLRWVNSKCYYVFRSNFKLWRPYAETFIPELN